GSTPARGSPTLIAAMPRPSSARSAEASTLCSYCLPSRKTCCGSFLDRFTKRGRSQRPRPIQHPLHLVRYNCTHAPAKAGSQDTGVPSPLNRDDDHIASPVPCWVWVGADAPHSLERR